MKYIDISYDKFQLLLSAPKLQWASNSDPSVGVRESVNDVCLSMWLCDELVT